MRKRILPTIFAIGLVVLFLLPQSGRAISIIGNTAGSTEIYGNFTGDLTYDPDLATLTVTLTNTTSGFDQGFLTGFLFNIPDNHNIDAELTDSDFSSFEFLFKKDKLKASPFGKFDIGAALGGNFLGGGDPHDGIGIGETGTFIFTFKGSNLDSLTDQDFVDALSSKGEFFVARFKGIEPGDLSNKVTATVPEPATLLLVGSGIALLGLWGRRKSKNRGL
jgi:hypothetical protein